MNGSSSDLREVSTGSEIKIQLQSLSSNAKDTGIAVLISTYHFIRSPAQRTAWAALFSHHHWITYVTSNGPWTWLIWVTLYINHK